MKKINLKKVGKWLTLNNLWHKPFNAFSKKEIEGLYEIILSEKNVPDKIIISRCYVCGSTSFWRFRGENQEMWTCLICHPPAVKDGLEFLKIIIGDKKRKIK